MFFSLTELEHHPVQFDVAYPAGEIKLPQELRQDGEVQAKGHAELLRNTLGEIRVRGTLKGTVVAPCDRCLDDSRFPIDAPFDLYYRPVPEDEDHHHHERRIAEGEVDLSFYQGNGLELGDVVREFILLSLPMRIFCRENCLGICPVCGENRNTVACQCSPPKLDDRWSVLRSVIEK